MVCVGKDHFAVCMMTANSSANYSIGTLIYGTLNCSGCVTSTTIKVKLLEGSFLEALQSRVRKIFCLGTEVARLSAGLLHPKTSTLSY